MGKRIELAGVKVGCLTAIEKAKSRIMPSGATVGYWIVECECGKRKEISVQSFTKRMHKTCANNCGLAPETKISCVCAECGCNFIRKRKTVIKNNNIVLCSKCIAEKASIIGAGVTRGKPSPNRLPDGVAAFNSLYVSYKRNAINRKRKSISFDLTQDQFRELTSSCCYYCGISPGTTRNGDALRSKGKTSGQYIYNGIDRLDSDAGYTIGNVVPCCSACNFMKRDMNEKQFLSMIERISKFQNRKSS